MTPRGRPNALAVRRLFDVVTRSPEETMELGRRLAPHVSPPCLVLLEGELGSGKTTLAKGIVAGLGAAREEEVTSPTFTLIHEYGGAGKVFHADLYRIEEIRELSTLGLEEVLEAGATLIVEWGEKLGDNARPPLVRIRLEHFGSEGRHIVVERVE